MEFSLLSSLLIFYLLIFNSSSSELMGKQMKTYIKDNRLAQHVIAFIMMFVLIILVGGFNNVEQAVLYSILAYVWFIFTTKLDIQWNVMTVCILLFGFLHENKMILKEKSSDDDDTLTQNDKNKIKQKNIKIKKYTTIAAISVTVIGTLLYGNKKTLQYGGGEFSAIKYLLY
jgi:hypothetical protein